MKRIVIGRGIDCDIVIPDEKDNVSRHHLVISFGLFGKMTISDTSSNGTFVNDRKLLKGASVPVTREDKVRLGNQWTLNWDLVKDPYTATRRVLLGCIVFCMLAIIACCIWYYSNNNKPKENNEIVIPVSKEKEQDDVWTKDSTNKIAPKDNTIKTNGLKKISSAKKKTKHTTSKRHKQAKKGSNKSVQEMKKNDVSSEKSMPIVN